LATTAGAVAEVQRKLRIRFELDLEIAEFCGEIRNPGGEFVSGQRGMRLELADLLDVDREVDVTPPPPGPAPRRTRWRWHFAARR
jgi:hypothetical protein